MSVENRRLEHTACEGVHEVHERNGDEVSTDLDLAEVFRTRTQRRASSKATRAYDRGAQDFANLAIIDQFLDSSKCSIKPALTADCSEFGSVFFAESE